MDYDTVYFWTKNQGPSQNHDRNRCAEHCLAEMSTVSGIIKTYHVSDDQLTHRYRKKMDGALSKDLRPFVVYSMNKRRNWEIEEISEVDLMGEIQKMHPGEDVVLLERVAMRIGRWPNVFRYPWLWNDFRVTEIKQIVHESGHFIFKKTSVNSIRGQHVEHFEESNRASCREDFEVIKNMKETEDRTLVAYHLVKPPQNYSKLFEKQFSGKYLRPGRWYGAVYLERKRMNSIRDLEIRYDDYSEDMEVDEEDDEEQEHRKRETSFYKLDEHFVDKFVHVKRRKTGN